MELVKAIEKEVKRRCDKESNVFGAGSWTYHIKPVVDNGIILAKRYNADLEVVTLAALLHDIASVTNEKYYEEHHIIGAEIADELLSDLRYPRNRIEHVKKCILNHRGSKVAAKLSIEEVCVADADAIAHFYNIPSLFSLVYKERSMGIEEGSLFVKKKLERSYNKLSEESKEFYKEKYEESMSTF